jgi:hypothetical protein
MYARCHPARTDRGQEAEVTVAAWLTHACLQLDATHTNATTVNWRQERRHVMPGRPNST